MNLDEFIKYLIWIVFFSIALIGLYTLFRNLGVI